jgi:hypothetical protein
MKRKNWNKEKKAQIVALANTKFGLGLIARRAIAIGECVVAYGGRAITTDENLATQAGRKRAGFSGALVDGCNDFSYMLQLNNGEYRVGGMKNDIPVGRLGSYANDPTGLVDSSGDPVQPNVEYRESDIDGEPYLYALKPISKGEEIFADYSWTPRTWRKKGVIVQTSPTNKGSAAKNLEAAFDDVTTLV